ncbi:MAG: nucleotidyl transferase AbiEii/AbiGii toxin family protein [Treponema sp.]|jgi:predicted nucleotidyltransferase component of viral defense system|nr:nucleotidyl transferase AbiEii/AbiGii toxin family protein [Treponema sp.]
MADIGTSILARLKNKAKESKISYQQCLQLFFQEEFLRRISKSPYVNNLILKGGLFIYTLTNFQSRATVDIDFMVQRLDNYPERLDEVIAEIISVPTGLNETVILEAGKCVPIATHREYSGLSSQITGKIKKVRVPFNIDIGAGDIIVPKPERRKIQTQLEGYDPPKIYTYSLESTIAEKFDAILQRFELTGRMKDFYDIFYLAQTFDFDGQRLGKALKKTLQNRKTEYDKESFDRVLQLADDNDIQARWQYFQKTVNQTGLSLSEVMHLIDKFLHPVFVSLVLGEDLSKRWDAGHRKWE